LPRPNTPDGPLPYSQSGNLQDFRLACFQFQLRLHGSLELPPYKGASFHGALGLALAKIGTRFRDFFYQPTPPAHWKALHQKPPKPYILIPPLDGRTHYQAGDTLDLGLVLYGPAIDYLLIIFAALEHLGEYMGLGKQRGHFSVERITQISPDGVRSLYQNNHWVGQSQALHAAQFFAAPSAVAQLRLKHTTRLRLKTANDLLRTAPPFGLLMHRLLGRINTLATLYSSGIVITPEEKQHLLALADTVTIEHSTLEWHDWQRYSQRSQSTMSFGGLLGETVYTGELSPFVPWLALGQWVGVGGKTSFGLGLYELEIMNENT